MGIKTIMEARAILLLAFGENKADATAGRSRTSPGLSSPRGGGSGERGIARPAWAGFARSKILSWWQKRGAVLIDIPADRFAERSRVGFSRHPDQCNRRVAAAVVAAFVAVEKHIQGHRAWLLPQVERRCDGFDPVLGNQVVNERGADG